MVMKSKNGRYFITTNDICLGFTQINILKRCRVSFFNLSQVYMNMTRLGAKDMGRKSDVDDEHVEFYQSV